MILQALNSYYERLAAKPDSDIAPYGFSRQKMAFCIVLNPDGSLNQIEELQTREGKRVIPHSLVVCGNAKPSGSGINPGFLWDNLAYMLGYKPDDPKPDRTRKSFEAFRGRHRDLESTINDPAFSAVCRFLESWNPETAESYETLKLIGTGFGVFRISGEQNFVHEVPAVLNWWDSQTIAPAEFDDELMVGQCLVTSRIGPIARVHDPKIKAVSGAQTAGAALVSFNLKAAESYGKVQSNNAPVSERAAFQYCTALNALLADRTRRVQIGDATVVFWTEQPESAEEILGIALGAPPPEDQVLADKIHKTLQAIAGGKYPSEFGDKETPFYILGLSPNAARVSVRFWHESTLGKVVEHLRQHYADLAIVHAEHEPDLIAPWQILRETAREAKEIPPLLSGGLMEAVLTGRPYPAMLLAALIRRIRADRSIRYVRIAAMKACLNRSFRSPFSSSSSNQELTMALDPDRQDVAYRLGRLFAELEKAQTDALPGINDTIKDRYFGAASSTPASVFPRLIRMNQHHMGKLEKAARIHRERRIQNVYGDIHGFPAHLNLRDQGLFSIGYYHQRQEIFAKKSNPDSASESTQPSEE